MSYINVRDFRVNASGVLRKLEEDREPRIVLRRGKPVAVLLPADDDAAEAAAFFRRARAQIAVRAIREEARRRGLDKLTVKQIDAIIQRARTRRR
jgi:prevent-host-death family protein